MPLPSNTVIAKIPLFTQPEKHNASVTKLNSSYSYLVVKTNEQNSSLKQKFVKQKFDIIICGATKTSLTVDLYCTPCPKKGSHQTFGNNFLKS